MESESEMTICDHCSTEIPVANANETAEHGTLCGDCYAELVVFGGEEGNDDLR